MTNAAPEVLQVLLIEDNPADAELVCLALQEVGAAVEVHRAERLADALLRLAEGHIDAALLDMNLPDASEFDGVRALQDAFPRVPIVVLTGGSADRGVESLIFGAQDYLSKDSLHGSTIQRALRYSIERQRHRERAQELAAERASREVAEANARLLELSYRVAEAGLVHTDVKECLRAIVAEVRDGFRTDTATILLTHSDESSLIVGASIGLAEREGERIPMGRGIAGTIAESGRARVIPMVEAESIWSPVLSGLASMMGTPLRLGGKTIGVLHVGSLRERGFTLEELRMLDTLGSRIALVLENAQLRERARFEEERWRTVVETMSDMVCIADGDGRIQNANDALRGWLGSTAVSEFDASAAQTGSHFQKPDGAPLSPEELPLPRAARGEEVRQLQLLFAPDAGDARIGSFTASPIKDDEGGRRAIVLVGHDVTEQTRAAQALREADRRKDEFLAVLSHELRNPLAPISSSLYLLRRSPAGSPQSQRALDVIERQVEHITQLVGDLLDVSRISRGKVQLHKRRVDLGQIVSRSVEDIGTLFAARGVELRAEVGSTPTWVEGDPTRLSQSISNLLDNAAKFTLKGGRVTVAVVNEGPTAVVRVLDTGVGISPEMLEHLFEPFAQADRTLDRSAGGLGVGLALVKGLIELHGGSVAARSDGPGTGAEFTLRLPASPSVIDERAPPERGSPPPRAQARRILIIEDNVDAALSLKEALELQNHEVVVAHAGPEGLATARAFSPEVVLCDIGLPGMDGYSVARNLRRDPTVSSAYLVALTGYALPLDQQRAREAGFDFFLAKPPDLGALERVLGSSF